MTHRAGTQDRLGALVARCRNGDRDALDALVRELQPTICKLARRFLMVPADAEDATQEILLKIITRLGQFEGKSQFETWAYRVACNHLLDVQRRLSPPTVNFDEFAADLADGLADVPFQGPEAARLFEEVRIGCTLAMLQCLGPDARMAYVLGEILELEHREAAEVLGIGTGTYRKRLSRARKTVSAFMRGNCGMVNPENPCRCSKRALRAEQLGRIDLRKPAFLTPAGSAQQFPEILAEIRRLEHDQRAAALFRAQREPRASQEFLRWLKSTLEQREAMLANR